MCSSNDFNYRMFTSISVWFLGISVSVEAFTLICITIERYMAICHPLVMTRLRSMRHSSRVNVMSLILIWTLACLSALPNFSMYQLCLLPTSQTLKCEKIRSNYIDERLYMITLDSKLNLSLLIEKHIFLVFSSLFPYASHEHDAVLCLDYSQDDAKESSNHDETSRK